MKNICLMLLVLVAGGGHALAAGASGEGNLLRNGDFEEPLRGDDGSAAWQTEGEVKRIKKEAGHGNLRLSGDAANPDARASQIVPFEGQSLATLSALVKGKNITPVDPDSEGVAVVSLQFLTREGKELGKKRDLAKWEGNFGWRPWTAFLQAPPGTSKILLTLDLRGAAGRVEFDDVRLAAGLPDDRDRGNFLVDGGFEYHNALGAWAVGNGTKVVYPGHEGHGALLVSGKPSEISAAFQETVIEDASLIRNADLKFSYTLDEVTPNSVSRGEAGVRVELRFQDAWGETVGKSVFGPWTGLHGWKTVKESFRVPPECRRLQIWILIEQASGSAGFDNMRLAFSGETGPLLRNPESRTDTSNWTVYRAPGGPLSGVMDASEFLDPPAGRHGFLQAGPDGHFYFEDGTRARFFGVNIQAPRALPTHDEAKRMAEHLAQLGVNLVRFHHLDARWARPNIFDSAFDDTKHLSAESLDRLDYFIAQLKARGIYVYLDLLVSRKFKKGDGVPSYKGLASGAKDVGQFNRRIIALQKKYARDLLTHFNVYTQARLTDEPAVALVDIANENSLCRFDRKKLRAMPAVYLDELKRRFKAYAGEKGLELFTDFERPEVREFYAGLQRAYFSEMRDFLRFLGLKVPVSGSNLAMDGWDLATNAELDFIDRHAYWAHPIGGYGEFVKFHHGMLTKEVEPEHREVERKRINPIVKVGRLRVRGKPFVVGEWNVNWPHEYRALGPILMASYALFQDWDGILQFNYDGDFEADRIENNFDVSNKPDVLRAIPFAARMFHRGDISPAREAMTYPIMNEGVIPPSLPLIHRVERVHDAAPPASYERPRLLASDTEELMWNDEEGFVTIDTGRLQAVCGAFSGTAQELTDMTVSVDNPFACVGLASLDGRSIREASRLVLLAVARAENTGMAYNATRTQLRTSGVSPILLEPVTGTVRFPRIGTAPVTVYAVKSDGTRGGRLKHEEEEGSVALPLTGESLYEIVIEAQP
jgi:hypothetical protein